MDPMVHAHVVLNPAAARGRAGEREAELREALEDAGFKPTIERTQRPGDGTELARAAIADGAEFVMAAGGDGTVNDVAQPLVGTETALGVLPMGSGNDYARVLSIPGDLRSAAKVLAQHHVRAADVGDVGTHYYLNSLGMGIEGQIAQDYRNMRLLKGEVGYLSATLFEIVRFRPFRAEVRGEGWQHEAKLLSVSVMNGPHAGGGFCLAPRAAIDDGQLDIALLGHYPRLVRFWVLPQTRDGSYLKRSRVRSRKADRITISADRALPVHMDGELLPSPVSELEIRLRPRALHVLGA